MDVLFQCTFTVDKKRYLSWARENNAYPIRRALTICWCAIAAALLACALYTRWYVLLWFFLFAVYRAFFRYRLLAVRQYSLLSRQYGTENWTRSISFEEGNIVTAEGSLSINTPYTDVTGIAEKDGYIRLLLKNKNVIRLYSDCFTTGTWEECRDYITGSASIQKGN